MVSLDNSGQSAGVSLVGDPHSGNSLIYADDIRYAGFWIRLIAYIIDAVLLDIILAVGIFIVTFVMAVSGNAAGAPDKADSIHGIANLAVIMFGGLYFALFTASGWQATPGKRMLGLHVIRTDGKKIEFGLSVGRYFASILSSFILGFGFLMIGWSREKRALHDRICNTRVVYGKPRPRNLATVFE